MKIYINTITPEEYINAIEDAKDKPQKDKDLAESLMCPKIKNKDFQREEWKHVEDDELTAEDLANYPHIKEAHIVLKERSAQAVDEKCLGQFATALKTFNEEYSQEVPAIVTDVLKLKGE